MALTNELDNSMSPLYRILKHSYKTEGGAATIALVAGVAGKRVKIWRLHVTCAAAEKSCEILSGTDPFITLFGQANELKGTHGIPIYTCNAGDDFNANPNDQTTWYFYTVYSIE